MKTLEEILKQLEYLTVEEVENPKWKLEDLTKLSTYLNDEDFLTYIVYLSLRPDLPPDDRDTCEKIIKVKRALEARDIAKKYNHFETITN